LSRLVILDSGPTGLAGKARGRPDADACHAWIEALKAAGYDIAIPGIVRYEVRRELFRVGNRGGINRLDHLHPGLAFLPVTEEILDIASELWAAVRRAGLPTAADDALDGDAILAATAIAEAGSSDQVVIATTNVGHLARFPGIDAREWWTIT
jgi:predicted nucleic acid-binding protein